MQGLAVVEAWAAVGCWGQYLAAWLVAAGVVGAVPAAEAGAAVVEVGVVAVEASVDSVAAAVEGAVLVVAGRYFWRLEDRRQRWKESSTNS